MSTPTVASVGTADEALHQHRLDRLDLIREALDDHEDDPESALNYVEDIARRPLYLGADEITSMTLAGCLPVFEECEVYVPCDGLTDAEVLAKAKRAFVDVCGDEQHARVTWRGYVLMVAEHSDGNDIEFWFRRVQPDDRAVLMAHVTAHD